MQFVGPERSVIETEGSPDSYRMTSEAAQTYNACTASPHGTTCRAPPTCRSLVNSTPPEDVFMW